MDTIDITDETSATSRLQIVKQTSPFTFKKILGAMPGVFCFTQASSGDIMYNGALDYL